MAGIWLVGAMLAVSAGTVGAQGTVTGQVAIQERPGDVTEDLANVVIFLEQVNPAPPVSSTPPARSQTRLQARGAPRAVMALDKRQFSPRVAVIMAGSSIDFPNRDPFSHNVFSKAGRGFDTGVFGRNRSRDHRFDEPGVYPLYCNVHPRMTAFVVALATPHYSQAGVDGRFEIPGVPAGEYRMTVWHDRATMDVRPITVPAAGVRDLRVTLDARGYKFVQHRDKSGRDYTSRTGDRY